MRRSARQHIHLSAGHRVQQGKTGLLRSLHATIVQRLDQLLQAELEKAQQSILPVACGHTTTTATATNRARLEYVRIPLPEQSNKHKQQQQQRLQLQQRLQFQQRIQFKQQQQPK